MVRKYGWKPSKVDPRDLKVPEYVSLAALPPKVDLRPLCSPVADQGELGSCTGFASIKGMFEFLQLKEIRAKAPLDVAPEEFAANTYTPGSPLFQYYNERVIEGSVSDDAGAELRDAVKALAQYGVCPEVMWPYDTSKFAMKPTAAAYHNAALHKISQYASLMTLTQMKQTLAEGYVFIGGISVYESFESDVVAQTGVVPMPKDTEQCVGGHAICFVGYDDSKQAFIVRNSWGPGWGQAGYFTLPYAYVSNSGLASDFWVAKK